jgi:hypothetical protein
MKKIIILGFAFMLCLFATSCSDDIALTDSNAYDILAYYTQNDSEDLDSYEVLSYIEQGNAEIISLDNILAYNVQNDLGNLESDIILPDFIEREPEIINPDNGPPIIIRGEYDDLDYTTFLELLKTNGFEFDEPEFSYETGAKVINIGGELLIIFGHGIDIYFMPSTEITWLNENLWSNDDSSITVVYWGNDKTIITFLNNTLGSVRDE